MSSSQLTNSIIFRGSNSTTNQISLTFMCYTEPQHFQLHPPRAETGLSSPAADAADVRDSFALARGGAGRGRDHAGLRGGGGSERSSGEWWENHRKTIGKWWFHGMIMGLYPLVMTNYGKSPFMVSFLPLKIVIFYSYVKLCQITKGYNPHTNPPTNWLL